MDERRCEGRSAPTANMEFADGDASILQNDDVEAEKEDGLPTCLIPGYVTFNDYLQVAYLLPLQLFSPSPR